MNIKKKHHFVSQFYLKNWLLKPNAKICAWDGEENFFETGTENIAHSKSFYKIVPLKEQQINLFDEFATSLHFTDLSEYKDVIKPIIKLQKTIILSKGLISLIGEENIEGVDKKVDLSEKQTQQNTLEDKFSFAEGMFSILFKKIINGNIGNLPVITFKDYDLIAYFIAFQLAKTPKKIRKITFNDGHPIYDQMLNEFDFTEDELHTFTLFLLQCFTEKMYLSILNKLYKLNIYYNNSDINFITSDDPCFNQKNDEQKFHVQIPISPKVMIEITENLDEMKDKMIPYYEYHKENLEFIELNDSLVKFMEIDSDEVLRLNRKMEKNKEQFVYGLCKEDFLGIKS